MTRVIIFGATSAIAGATARIWAARGWSIYLVGRNAQKLQALEDDLRARASVDALVLSRVADLDLIDTHAALIEDAAIRLGGLDIALIAHGTLPDQTRCENDVGAMMAQMLTNGLSAMSLAGQLASRFEAQRQGCIAVITSVAGNRGRQSNYAYGAAKGMLIVFLEGLRNRMTPSAVGVVDIRPGFVDTPMTAAIPKSGPLWAGAERVAVDIVHGVDRHRGVIYTPWFWRYIMMIIRSIPDRIFNRLKL